MKAKHKPIIDSIFGKNRDQCSFKIKFDQKFPQKLIFRPNKKNPF